MLLRMMFTPVDLLVLDYPFYTIDEQIKSELLRCIAVLQSRGTAVLWSSNDRSVLEEHCENTVACECAPGCQPQPGEAVKNYRFFDK